MTELVFQHSDEHYISKYSRRSSIMDEYKTNMMVYLKHSFPGESEEKLKQLLNDIIKEQYKPARLKYFEFSSSCSGKSKEQDLLEVTNTLNDNIYTPYGTTFCHTSELTSVFSEYIKDNQAERKQVKKQMFLANARNDKETESIYNRKQMNIKININVLSGVMLSSVTFRSAINYNTITGTARFNIMTAYAVVEMCMASNYYFQSEDRAINWIVNCLRIIPPAEQLKACIQQYNLKQPTNQEVFEAYYEQILYYTQTCKGDAIRPFIESLSQMECTFVYYAMNLKRLIFDNDTFKAYFELLLCIDSISQIEGDIPDIAKLPDEFVSTFAVVILSNEIGSKALSDISAQDPELSRRIYSVYKYLEGTLDELSFLMKTFITIPITPSDVISHRNMVRNTVLLSDTDSILFTNVQWIKWYADNLHVTENTNRFNIMLITLVSKILEHTFGYQSACMGIDPENIRLLAMKNEFMYDLFLRTPISKHYAGYARYREGVKQDPYKFDLKGKNFKGSDLCKEAISYVKWFIKYIFDSYLKDYKLIPEDMIAKVIIFEQRIKKSIEDGEVTFLRQTPIQQKHNYKKPESSNYLYYELWQAVFAEKYGDLHPPQKTKELPIIEICAQSTTQLDHMKAHYGVIYERLMEFMSRYPKRKISRILIPLGLEIPEELRLIADYRKVCAMSCFCLELILRSFNISNFPSTKKQIILFSDTYQDSILQEITDEQRDATIQAAAQEEIDDIFNEDDYDEEDEEAGFDEFEFDEY